MLRQSNGWTPAQRNQAWEKQMRVHCCGYLLWRHEKGTAGAGLAVSREKRWSRQEHWPSTQICSLWISEGPLIVPRLGSLYTRLKLHSILVSIVDWLGWSRINQCSYLISCLNIFKWLLHCSSCCRSLNCIKPSCSA